MEPFASKIRPTSLDEFVGQEHLVGPGKPLREAIEGKHLFSFILWGPPGSGKTTLARMYANALDAEFHELSAVDSGKEDIKNIVGKRGALQFGKPKILFIDEIHRFNKAQQDFLLPFVENGQITLIGATTENPSFEVIPALLSRARVFVLNEHKEEDMKAIIAHAVRQLAGGKLKGKVPASAQEWLINYAAGDARQLIGILESTQQLYGKITVETLSEAVQSKHLRFDKKGEEHYNTVSAFIKSMRASQPDAALYYLARMIKAGEDPLFVARRMVIFASEDVGLAQPTALVVANAVFEACQKIGYPECALNLAHGAAYLAQSKKDRSANDAIGEALNDVEKFGNLPIPLKIRNASTKLMKDVGYGKGYEKYDQESYLPEKLKNKKYLKRKTKEEKE
jgi:putative ATPase